MSAAAADIAAVVGAEMIVPATPTDPMELELGPEAAAAAAASQDIAASHTGVAVVAVGAFHTLAATDIVVPAAAAVPWHLVPHRRRHRHLERHSLGSGRGQAQRLQKGQTDFLMPLYCFAY